MRPYAPTLRQWLPVAPRWSAVFLGALIAADAAHLLLRMHMETHLGADTRAVRPPSAAFSSLDPQQIAAAHLFGLDPAAARARAASRSETPVHLALSGVIATSDPNDGYAMLGEQGHTTRLYRTGTALANEGEDAGSLYQVFADRVVLDFDGRLETVRLPREVLNLSAHAPRQAGTVLAATPDATEEPPSEAQSWFSNLNTERYLVAGRTALRLHPTKYMERRYGLHDGDTLNAVNGVPATDEDAVDSTLRAGGQTVALTLTHNGVQETLTFSLDD